MALIMVNNDKVIRGFLSITRQADFNANPVIVQIAGKLETHRYIEEINSLETRRYKLEDIQVVEENYGSEDFNIIYTFVAKKLIVKGRKDSDESPLDENSIYELEKTQYGENLDIYQEVMDNE